MVMCFDFSPNYIIFKRSIFKTMLAVGEISKPLVVVTRQLPLTRPRD